MTTLVVQFFESLTVRDRWDIADSDEPLSIDYFVNKNYFAAALH